MSGTLYGYAVTDSTISAEEVYRREQARIEAARRAREEAARREAERRARVEAERQRVREQSMALAAQQYRAANPTLIAPTPSAVMAETARAESASRQSSEEALRHELAQARAANVQRALDSIEKSIRQSADQQLLATATAAFSALEDAKTLAIESQMWVAAGAPGDALRADDFAAHIKSIEATITTDPDKGRTQADTLAAQLRTQRGDLARAHFRRWSDLLVDCGFERGRVQGLLDRLNANTPDTTDQRVAALAAQLTAADKALGTVLDQDQAYTLSLDDMSRTLANARGQYDELAEKTFDLIAEIKQRRTADTIAAALGALGYRKDIRAGTLPQVERVGDRLIVTALRQNPTVKSADQKMVAFFVDENGGVKGDFSGYADRECEAAAEEVFAEVRRRGVILVNEDAAVRLRNADPATLSADPQAYAGPEFAPKLDHSKRQPELRRRVINALRRMGFQESEIQETVEGGTIIIGASHGSMAYRVVLTPESNRDTVPDDVASEVARDGIPSDERGRSAQPAQTAKRTRPWRKDVRAKELSTGR